MDDRDKKLSKPGMPPLPPGFLKPNLPQLPQAGKPLLPAGAPQLPSFGQPSFAPQFAQPQQALQPARDAAAEETERIKEDKDKLEKKISDMEKLLSQEKEKALLATLKNQQDEALSSRVESSLKDIQEKMRRDRRDHEVEEERLTLKSKIKEMETRLAQERETWMQTLKNQMSERETQGKDVEGHFIYRLQEMERRWLDEKAQWQKEISGREETIRSLKSSAEKLRDVEDEFRRTSLEKAMVEKEAAKLRDEVARAEREKASIESYIKIIPDKEREIAQLRSENAILKGKEEISAAALRSREEAARLEAGHRDEKYNFEIGRLQAELGSISDRKNEEKNEALARLQANFETQLHEKERIVADISGEKVRAVSELVKIKGFIGRVQAINAVLEKERGQLRLEKMQLAQNMAAQLEELHRLKQEADGLKAAHEAELRSQAENFKSEINRVKNGYGLELAHKHAEETAEIVRAHQEETARLAALHQLDLSKAAAAHQQDFAKAAAARQAELARLTADYQAGLARTGAERQAEADAKISQMRMQYEAAAEEEKNAIRRQLEAAYTSQLQDAKASSSAALNSALKLEVENRRLAAAAADFDNALAARTKEFSERLARAEADTRRQEAEAGRQEAQVASAFAQKAEFEKAAREAEAERQRLSADNAAMREQQLSLAARKEAAEAEAAKLGDSLRAQAENLRVESENRARFESELLFLKQKIQQMEYQSQENEGQLEAERSGLASLQSAAAAQQRADAARIEELSAELERYKTMENSLAGRLKWAVKGKQE